MAKQSALADLHRHLDGSMRAETLQELYGKPLPKDLRFTRGMGLDAALSKFAFILSLLKTPSVVRRVASEICEDAILEGVSTLEIRFAPQLHGRPEEFIDAALEGIAGRAGLIVCGLYGEDPSVLRSMLRTGVNGIDLAGGPAPTHAFKLSDYARVFREAEDRGIGRTVHAGEGRPPSEIRVAIEELHAMRIGHGTTLLDDPRVVELIIERGVTIEACPTSNVHTGAIENVESHPLPKWLALGVRACICTDNTFLSATTSPQEHLALGLCGEDYDRVVANGHAAAFSVVTSRVS
jgi:adenosine deaminase